MKTTLIILVIISLLSCTDNREKSVAQKDRLELIPEPDKDLRVEYEQQQAEEEEEEEEKAYLIEDTTTQNALIEKLKPINENVNRINEITEWTSVDERDLEQSTEGGTATYYFQKDTLLKIAVVNFGETGKAIQEFYTKDGQLSFVLETDYTYNRPITWDSTAMKENNDTQVFDMDQSEIMENASYFDNGILIQYTNSQDCGAPFAADYLKNIEADLKSEFESLKELVKE
ncbi:hypothetical protein GCM10011506_48130 [Marivirga lumbricoides]|uniref:Lipoprotein n=1 Tax=Marivirga lumbricoides TaxID=1046115 RepID=A0ABQ1N792_9BACT|nr:hypothetical protein GCM10011506_48130 [Marivirga lumbricoides]